APLREKDFFAPSGVLSVAVCLISAQPVRWASQLYYFGCSGPGRSVCQCNLSVSCKPPRHAVTDDDAHNLILPEMDGFNRCVVVDRLLRFYATPEEDDPVVPA